MPLTSLHITSKGGAVGFLANAEDLLGGRACVLEGSGAGRELEAIPSRILEGAGEEGGE